MLIDSYSWIEFFIGTEKGKKVEKMLEEGKNFTSIVSIAEITEWCLKNNKNINYFINIVKKYSTILELSEDICSSSGKINFERKKKIKSWGMIDSLILSTALIYELKVLTGDRHFSDMENAVML